jgi:hypothetical protein
MKKGIFLGAGIASLFLIFSMVMISWNTASNRQRVKVYHTTGQMIKDVRVMEDSGFMVQAITNYQLQMVGQIVVVYRK